jgi:uncharacterized protein (TIGR02118 family)
MIKVSVLYPSGDGKTFDDDYYRDRHMPMVQQLVGDKLKDYSIDRGIGGGAADAPPPFLAAGHLLFESMEDYETGFGPHTKAIMADVANYTNIRPTLQISEMVR